MHYFVVLMGLFMFILNGAVAHAELQDPTRPVTEITSDEYDVNGLRLSAIIISPDRRVAVINERTLKLGDDINGVKITRIESNFVEIEKDHIRSILYLLSNSIKREN